MGSPRLAGFRAMTADMDEALIAASKAHDGSKYPLLPLNIQR